MSFIVQQVAALNPRELFESMRPKQWIKNAFVLPALIFSHNIFNPPMLLAAVKVLTAFCLLSSAVYLVNDIVDRERDRAHPRKRNRPIAAGLVTPWQAGALSAFLAVASLQAAFSVGLWVGVIGVVYLLQTLLYSFYLKEVPLIDIFVIALGFVLRVLAGGAAIRVPISPWLLTTTVLLALFLALAKRRSEVAVLRDPGAHRAILAEYSLPLIDQLIGVVSSSTVVVYTLYSSLVSEGGRLIYTVPFVLFGIFRYLYLIHRRQAGGEPETVLLRDRPLLVNIILYGVATISILYFPGTPG